MQSPDAQGVLGPLFLSLGCSVFFLCVFIEVFFGLFFFAILMFVLHYDLYFFLASGRNILVELTHVLRSEPQMWGILNV